MANIMPYPLWTDLPYAGEKQPPGGGIEPSAGTWNTYFLKRSHSGKFETLDGKPVEFEILHPSTIDWYDQLKIVQRVAKNLTEKEEIVARYWGSGPPSKQWAPIVDRLIDTYAVEAPRAGRILGALFAGINDALVVTWYLKYKWLVPRPNQLDDQLATVICTPKHPSYPSGHATVSGAAETILSYFFPGERRRLRELAEEDAKSRLYALVHFPVDNEQGLRLGRQIGRIVVEQLEKDHGRGGGTVDTPYRSSRGANIAPPPYEQSIPFDFDQSCSSLLRDETSAESNYSCRKSNPDYPKPKLYLE
ncbi:vanadium-dependent haloperoxidase [Thalassobacillus sp. B23F22_16]|uniref:vanadium-dependent haloperoxidase n=1 Tax=Thalassobacillus sp. B23F22_16 TaxID=3459513 RepID=UPI00373FA10C